MLLQAESIWVVRTTVLYYGFGGIGQRYLSLIF